MILESLESYISYIGLLHRICVPLVSARHTLRIVESITI